MDSKVRPVGRHGGDTCPPDENIRPVVLRQAAFVVRRGPIAAVRSAASLARRGETLY
jgi:hypothetical protein